MSLQKACEEFVEAVKLIGPGKYGLDVSLFTLRRSKAMQEVADKIRQNADEYIIPSDALGG